ncbi:DNA replication/repair protein RecF [Oscillospiraceae bacterium MB08-C2-2]|nr:DNA replication/repair protein RecF [Oscillospiraceae bacterium MB08-C2-2]
MRVERLFLRHFRNVEQAELLPDAGVNVIWGDNAQGKTNLLESVWMFTGARSFRGSSESDLIAFGQEAGKLELDFYARGRSQSASLQLSEGKKTAFLNEIKLERASRLSGEFLGVVFSPDHLSLIKDGPEKRRRLIDTSLCQVYPKYISLLEGYSRVLRQRNALLKDVARHPSLLDSLDIWDEELCRIAGYMMFMRSRYIAGLEREAKEIYSGISSGKESFSMGYQSSVGEVQGVKAEELRHRMRKALEESRGEDIRLAHTQKGPHRDDLEILIDGKSARGFGSQGQQRSCVLALKLAECGLIKQSTGSSPVVLLDDVMSELDTGRREYLLNHLTGRQVFITCCDRGYLAGLAQGKSFHIKNGRLEEN